jgi:hypothetical protein
MRAGFLRSQQNQPPGRSNQSETFAAILSAANATFVVPSRSRSWQDVERLGGSIVDDLTRREFAVGGLSAGVLLAFGGCAGAGGGAATGGGAAVAAGAASLTRQLLTAVAATSLYEAGEWAAGWAREKLEGATSASEANGYGALTDIPAVVTTRTHAVYTRWDGANYLSVGVVPYTEKDDACQVNSHALLVALGTMAKYLSDHNPNMTAASIADALLPLRSFTGTWGAGMKNEAFATWATQVGAMNVVYDGDGHFDCRLLDGNSNVVSHSFDWESPDE